MSQLTPSPLFDSDRSDSLELTVNEYESTDPLDLSKRDLRMIKSEVNDGAERLDLTFDRDGMATLRATQYVGIVSLPDGPTLQIRPKAGQTNLLTLLRYAQGVQSETIEEETSISAGRTFIEALAALFEAELEAVIRQGLHRDYRRVEEIEDNLRGQLNVQKQIQCQGITPTQFECTYNELTYDTVPNKSALFAATHLTRFVRDQRLGRALQKHCHRLRQRVSLEPVRPSELEQIELTRLNNHYSDLIRLTKLVLRSIYVRDFTTGAHRSFALLIDMNQIFERTVERAFAEVFTGYENCTIESQTTTRNLVTNGKHTISIRPDILVQNKEREPILVGDAKWKLGRPVNADFYQMTSYQFAHNVPGVLIYPEQRGEIASQYTVVDQYPLNLIELPIPKPKEEFHSYTGRLRSELEEEIFSLLKHDLVAAG